MDCLCCADGGSGPSTDSEFLGSVCNLTSSDGVPARFPPEPNRYILYIVAGCPFAAHPWALQAIYGLPIKVVKLFPASYEDGWFFEPKSQGEQDLVDNFPSAQTDKDPLGHHHLKELYVKANPNFEGAVSVPLLWDTKTGTAVSNSSMGLAEMIETQIKPTLASRNQDLELFPTSEEDKKEHMEFCKWLHANVTTAVYKMNATKDGAKHDEMVDKYYQALKEVEDRLKAHDINYSNSFLFGPKLRFCDIILWISFLRLDLAYQFWFGLGKYNVREDYPRLQQYISYITSSVEGLKDTVLPHDIMALYYMTLKWTKNGNGRSLPMVPNAWEAKLGI